MVLPNSGGPHVFFCFPSDGSWTWPRGDWLLKAGWIRWAMLLATRYSPIAALGLMDGLGGDGVERRLGWCFFLVGLGEKVWTNYDHPLIKFDQVIEIKGNTCWHETHSKVLKKKLWQTKCFFFESGWILMDPTWGMNWMLFWVRWRPLAEDQTHRIHVGCICLHLVDFHGKCR